MRFSFWTEKLRQRMAGLSRRRREQDFRSLQDFGSLGQQVERCEERCLPSVSALLYPNAFNPALQDLTILMDSNDDVTVSVNGGFVQILTGNGGGAQTNLLGAPQTLAPASLARIDIFGSDAANSIFLIGVNAANGFRSDLSANIQAGDSDDIVFAFDSLGMSATGGNGADLLIGDIGSDSISGGDGADTILGGAGDDELNGGNGNDFLFGEDGSDLILGRDGQDLVDAGAGNDTVDGGNGDDFLLGFDGDDLINGGSGNDLIAGEVGIDSLLGGSGNDEIFGGDGNDAIHGNDGIDSILGGDGDDVVTGDGGDDVLSGNDGNDTLSGDAGQDTVIGDNGDDTIRGGAGDDSLLGGQGNDSVQGQAGNDTLEGQLGADLLDGGDGNDLLKADLAALQISGPISVSEGNSGTTIATFVVTLSGATNSSVTVDFSTLNGTASSGEDYLATSGTLQFAPGETTKTINIPVIGDVFQESDEDFFVILDNAVGATIAQNNAQGIIQNDGDNLVAVSINDITVTEGAPNATFVVRLSAVPLNPITVDFTTQNGTAVAGLDYQMTTNTLTIPAGQSQATFIVPILDDTALEATESFVVLLSNLTGTAVFAPNGNRASGTILDNEVPPPSVRIDDVSISEGNTGSRAATFTISLSSTTSQSVVVDYTIANGTAIAGTDYRLPRTFTGFSDPAVDSDSNGRRDGYVAIGARPDRLALGDTNGDGNLDLLSERRNSGILGTSTGNAFVLLRGNGDGTFENLPGRRLTSSASSIGNPSLIDLNNDGRLDAVGTRIPGMLDVFLNPNFTNIATGGSFVSGSAEYAIGDFTGDGLPDVAVVVFSSSGQPGSLRILRNDGNGMFSAISTLAVSSQSLFDQSQMDAGDVNGDGMVDLVVATADGMLRTYLGNGAGALRTGNVISNATFNRDMKLVDLDGDTDLDIALVSSTSDEVGVRLNSAGTFGAIQRHNVGARPVALDVGDVDRDGRQDIVTANRDDDSVSLLLGSGNGLFASAQDFSAGDDTQEEISPSDIALGDVNNDQLLDVVVGHNDPFYSTFVTVLLAQGNQISSGQITIPAGGLSQTLTVTIVGDTAVEPNETFLVNLTSAMNATIADAQGQGTIINDDSTGGLTAGGFVASASSSNGLVTPALPSNSSAVTASSSTTRIVYDTLLGGSGNDSLLGSVFDDLLNGGAGNDSLMGLAGNDSMLGGSGADTINGGDGNDTLNGQGGNDSVDGGAGDDQLVWTGASGASDTVSGSTGFDTAVINGTGAADMLAVGQNASGQMTVTDSGFTLTIQSSITNVILNANGGDDVVTIGSLSNVSGTVLTINGGDGNDNLDASGAVLGFVRMGLNGQAGDDTLTGGDGTDTLDGGDGNDSLAAGAGNDSVIGGAGDDVLSGQDGNDTLNGGDGDDFAAGGNGNDSVRGGDGNDTLQGQAGNDTLTGETGDDSLVDTTGNDSLDGGNGFDTLDSGDGNDTLDGGFGDDSLTAGAGNDKLRGGDGNDTLDAGDGDDELNAGDGDDQLVGGTGNDGLSGGDGDDLINGGAGNDIITGNDGNDSLLGGSGADTLLGGDGDDSINGQGGADVVAGNEGVDTLVLDASDSVNELFSLSQTLLDKLDGV